MRKRYCVDRPKRLAKNAKWLTAQRFAANGDRKGVDEVEVEKNLKDQFSVFLIYYH